MGKSYWLYDSSSADVIAQINSEQSALLTALWLTLTDRNGYGFNLESTNEDNNFYVMFTNSGSGTITTSSSGSPISQTKVTTHYANILCTENSLMITFSGNNSTGTKYIECPTIITKNRDGKNILITGDRTASSPNYMTLYVKEKNYSSVSLIPNFITFYDSSCNNFAQFSLANIPMEQPGEICENAFMLLSRQTDIPSGLGEINGVEYAVCKSLNGCYACR